MKNRNGIEVRACCMSCYFRDVDSVKGRICLMTQQPVRQKKRRTCCSHWEISEGLIHAGDSGGRVKSIGYLNYYRERYLQQRSDFIDGRIAVMMTTEEIRREYEEQFGSIYINI